MKKAFVVITPLLIGVIFFIAAFIWWNKAIEAPSTQTEEKRILIKKGASAESIGKQLQSQGVIQSAFAFKLYTQMNNLTKSIPPGEFSVPKNLTLAEVIEVLQKGPQELWVTIPEGFRREEIANEFIQTLGLTGTEADTFRVQFLSQSTNLEGYLFPDTYLFPKDTTADKVVQRLNSTFESKLESELRPLLSSSQLSLEEAVILASLIEREALSIEERPDIASVLINRLNEPMRLQVDATIQYAIGSKQCRNSLDCDWWQTPTAADREFSSPYNTYVVDGLPPAPIANPGIASLKAALNPSNTDYFYYIHDPDGQVHFGRTLTEHNQNVQTYLR